MYTHIIPKEWCHIKNASTIKTKRVYKHKELTLSIIEDKFEGYFKYTIIDNNKQYYIGKYNSEIGIFDDDLILVSLNSEY